MLDDGDYILKMEVTDRDGLVADYITTMTIDNVSITSPSSDKIYLTSGTIEIVGSVIGNSLNYYTIDYRNTSGGIWTEITRVPSPRVNDTLGIWEYANLPEGYYEIRVQAVYSNHTTTETVKEFLLNNPPKFLWLYKNITPYSRINCIPLALYHTANGGKGFITGAFRQKPWDITSVDGDGQIFWRYSFSYDDYGDKTYSRQIIADIDGDLVEETIECVFYDSTSKVKLTVLNAQGQEKYSSVVATGEYKVRGIAAVKSADGDKYDIALTLVNTSIDAGYLYLIHFNGMSFDTLWSVSLGTGGSAYPTRELAVGDIDGDMRDEIITGGNDVNLYCVDSDGSIQWTFPNPQN
ncbi:MAG: hypothetical protein Q8R48_01035, partial [Candidatus Omnitrophota bacterium]|nr:hypothetical protein [Candidatus Omnitrophota bacterium]